MDGSIESVRESVPDIVVVGAGLAGSLIAVLLARAGLKVHVYELRDDPRKSGSAGASARSINLALSTRGLTALKVAGLDDLVTKIGTPMHSRCVHLQTSSTPEFQPYGQIGQHLLSVSRNKLNCLLLDAVESEKNVSLYFGMKCIHVDLNTPKAIFQNVNLPDSSPIEAKARLIIGADGCFSKVRSAMERMERFNYSQSYLPAGYKELSIPAASDGSYQMDPNCLHIWPRHKYMLIALPNLDGSFTCTLFMDHEGSENCFDALQTPQQVESFFKTTFPDAVPLMPELTKDFFANPTPSLITIRCAPYHFKSSVLLIADAAHAIVPFYGQGINAGFEDCRILLELMHEHDFDFEKVCKAFTESRKPNADAVADLALHNYVEMASKTASTAFVIRRKLGLLLNRIFPNKFIPLYTFVSFSNVPYFEAIKRSEAQDKLLGYFGKATSTLLGLSVLSISAALVLSRYRLIRA